MFPLTDPFPGQRCSGRNNQGRRCCTPEKPCDEGEGDCDGPGDGGLNDGHTGCKGDLECGSNNCKQFGSFYHEKDDCCQKPSFVSTEKPPTVVFPGTPLEPPTGQRCTGRNYQGRRCCTPDEPCGEGEGDCDGPEDGGTNDGHAGCKGDLICGSNNCKQFGEYYHEKDDCCVKRSDSDLENKTLPMFPLTDPFPGQRCSGRNNQGRRCCTPEKPCDEGEGDCDGPGDGGLNDGHTGCKGDLECGSNNCKQFGSFYHEKDDCCQKPSFVSTEKPPPVVFPGTPLEPPTGQRCTGRNYQGRRCCTPDEPCGEGEGDCDGPEDGGTNDGHAGCKGDLICGSNNCKQFGAYYHDKDDCCEKPVPSEGWGYWQAWSQCSKSCGIGRKTRDRFCSGEECSHLQQTQERLCNANDCQVPLDKTKNMVNAFLCVLIDWFC